MCFAHVQHYVQEGRGTQVPATSRSFMSTGTLNHFISLWLVQMVLYPNGSFCSKLVCVQEKWIFFFGLDLIQVVSSPWSNAHKFCTYFPSDLFLKRLQRKQIAGLWLNHLPYYVSNYFSLLREIYSIWFKDFYSIF